MGKYLLNFGSWMGVLIFFSYLFIFLLISLGDSFLALPLGGATASCSCCWPSVAGDWTFVLGGYGSTHFSAATAIPVWKTFL